MTIFLGDQHKNGAKLVILISNIPAYQQNVIIQIYPYVFQDSAEFVDMVSNLSPALGWKSTVAIVPTLSPDTLPMFAHASCHSLSYDVLYMQASNSFHKSSFLVIY